MKKVSLSTVISLIFLVFLPTFNLLSFPKNNPEINIENIFNESMAYFIDKNYTKAIEGFNKLDSIQKNNANIKYKLGLCYLKSKIDLNKAIEYLEKSIEHTSKKYDAMDFNEYNVPFSAHFELGKAYQLVNKLKKAISQYKKCSSLLPNRALLQNDLARHIEMCKFSMIQLSNKQNVKITNLGENINSTYSDFGPILNADETIMVFTSNRIGSTGDKIAKDGKYYEDIYISTSDGFFWSKPKKISTKINSNFNDVAASFSLDGQQIILYNDQTGVRYLYHSVYTNGSWTPIVILSEIFIDSSLESHSSISLDGNLFYFSSSQAGGYGGSDIYRCKKLPNGEWAKAENLGPKINTKYDEITPFIHPNGSILFFSSKGHQNMGGFDVFSSELDENLEFSTPLNVGYPINTTSDERFFVLNTEGKRAYYSSIKSDGYGSDDIYMADFLDHEEISVTILKGIINTTKNPGSLDFIEILVYDNADLSAPPQVYKPNSTTGKYLIVLKPGKDYRIEYLLNEQIIQSEHLFIPEESAYQEIEKSIEIKPIELENK